MASAGLLKDEVDGGLDEAFDGVVDGVDVDDIGAVAAAASDAAAAAA
jgi:hypothetical protein